MKLLSHVSVIEKQSKTIQVNEIRTMKLTCVVKTGKEREKQRKTKVMAVA